MSKAQELVDNAKKTAAGVPLNFNELISELMKENTIEKTEATKQLGLAIKQWRDNRPMSVSEKVKRAIIDGTGKPKNLEFTERD